MRVIGGFDAHPGTEIGLRVTVSDDEGLETFAGVLKKFDEDGGGVVVKWSSAELLKGVSAVLGEAHGYDVVILPVSKPGTDPKLTVEMGADKPPYSNKQTVAVGDNIPFGYRIFLD